MDPAEEATVVGPCLSTNSSRKAKRRLLTLGKDLHFLTKLSDGYTASDALEISGFHF